jgi:triosephosphate isomerase
MLFLDGQVGPEVAKHLRIQYGGSVKGKTAQELAACPDIDGFLVGGSALTDDFVTIIANAEKGLHGDTGIN